MTLSSLPALNAGLNATSGILIIVGTVLIVRKSLISHAIVMVLAMLVSGLFLVSYLYYHFHHGATSFPHQGWIRPFYFTILISHTILAAVVPPLSVVTFVLAIKKKYLKHKKLSRILFPIWLYVSATGVGIYWMLYRM